MSQEIFLKMVEEGGFQIVAVFMGDIGQHLCHFDFKSLDELGVRWFFGQSTHPLNKDELIESILLCKNPTSIKPAKRS
jgi:hypothetical protein